MRCIFRHALSAVVRAGALVVLAGSAYAEVTFNAGATLSNDNNVNGSPDTPTKANQLSDNFLALSASAVYFTPLNVVKTSYFISQIGAFASSYNKYKNLNSSTLVASAGLYQQLSSTWSGQFTGRGFNRSTHQSERNSDGFGGTLEIKKQMTQTIWVKGVVDYEDNIATLGTYSYAGNTYGLNLGYLPLKDTFVNFGFSRNSRDFKGTRPFRSSTQTLFIEASQRLTKNWYLNGGYAYMINDSNIAGTAYTEQVAQIGVNYSY